MSIYSKSPTETARYLIMHAGGVQAAHDAVTRAAKNQKRKRGAPSKPDDQWIVIAESLQRREGCSDNAALKQVAKSEAMLRRLRRKLKGKPLAEAARELPAYGLMISKREKLGQ